MFHQILHNRYSKWAEIEELIEELPSNQDKGEVFEQFVFAYLNIHKDYYQIKDLYRAKNLPLDLRDKLKLEPTDYGVDGVFVLHDETIAAYQAKFRHARGTATVRELATFWSEASRADHKYVIANATELPKPAGKHSYSILADKFDELDADFFDSLHEFVNEKPIKELVKAIPDAHQIRMIEKTVEGFNSADRGKLIAACGAGKTLTSLWIIEAMNVPRVLILVPSLALIKQTLEAWAKHKKTDFSYLCVCSDKSVVEAKELDYGEYEISEIDFPVTTDSAKIKLFLNSKANVKYVFSTYSSAQAVADAMNDQPFDLIIFDEAHRTAGQKQSNVYSTALNDDEIPAKKRLFMTATERLIQPWIITKAAEEDRIVFSMDDKNVYGELFDRYSFGEAIQDGVISDYKILLTAVTAAEIESLIQQNRLIIAEGDESERLLTAENIYKQTVLYKAMKQFDIKKTITFHSSVKRAKGFVNGSSNQAYSLEDLYKLIAPEISGLQIYFDWVDGTMPTGLRKQKLKEFEASDVGVISNAQCLTEGVDVPIIDSIYFVDPKASLVDIVQACGRALRKSRSTSGESKTAYFIVPIIINDDDDIEDMDTGKFETLLNLVQALRNQDERMADWIDKINLGYVKGGGWGPSTDSGPIVIDFPKQFDLSKFTSEIQVKVYEGVKGPSIRQTNAAFSVRKSSYRKVFKALGDYSYLSYIDNLVNPTIEKFSSADRAISPADIKIVNNNVSHTLRLGLIERKKDGNYQLTELGKKYRNKEVGIEDIFREAMLSYNCQDDGAPLFPYRAALTILGRVNSINRVEFLYAIYSLQNSLPASIEESVSRIATIRHDYPNIMRITDANKTLVLKELNEKFGENFSEADLWASTTATNKFIYFKNHLSLFDGIVTTRLEFALIANKKQELLDQLEAEALKIV